MRLLVDNLLVKPEQAGIRSVSVNLTRALADSPGVDVHVVAADDVGEDWGAISAHTAVKLTRNAPIARAAWRMRHLGGLIERWRPDAVFTPAPEGGRFGRVPRFGMVHDLGPLLAPGIYGTTRFLRYAATLGPLLRGLDGVFCVSRTTQQDVVRWCGLDVAPKLHVLYNAPQPLTSYAGEPGKGAAERPFVLYVGAYLPHKNVRTLLRATIDADLELVCVGPDYGGERAALEREFAHEPRVRWAGFVSNDELSRLYPQAAVVAFPSLFEGFGMPLVEALRAGTRVLASPLPVFRELAGDAATYVADPLDPRSWREGLSQVFQGPPPTVPAIAQRTWDDVAIEAVAIMRRGALA